MTILVKRVGEDLDVIHTQEKYRGETARKVLGSNIEARGLWLDAQRTLSLVFDDEIIFKENSETNFLIEVPNYFAPIQPIRGDVVFIRTKPCNPFEEEIWDYEVEDLREQDIEDIRKLLSDETQIGLTLAYFLGGE